MTALFRAPIFTVGGSHRTNKIEIGENEQYRRCKRKHKLTVT
jgi:hypothetical protein